MMAWTVALEKASKKGACRNETQIQNANPVMPSCDGDASLRGLGGLAVHLDLLRVFLDNHARCQRNS